PFLGKRVNGDSTANRGVAGRVSRLPLDVACAASGLRPSRMPRPASPRLHTHETPMRVRAFQLCDSSASATRRWRLVCMLGLGAVVAAPAVPRTYGLTAQETVVRPAPPLAGFAAMRVAIFPVQLWRA